MIIDLSQLRDKIRVFDDRFDAGRKLAEMLSVYKNSNAIILALPAGGVPVAAAMAEILNLPVDVAVVSKITLPWNTEVGFGAIAFDGTVLLNDTFLKSAGLNNDEINQRIRMTREKVNRRLNYLRGSKPFPDLTGKTVLIVDDGIASGFTMRTAIKAVKKLNAKEIIIAVPTAHSESLRDLLPMANSIYCPNLRSGFGFAVAEAYKKWSDVDERDALEILKRFK